jgi:hypothetical protein
MSGVSEGIGLNQDRPRRHASSRWGERAKSFHRLIWIGIAITSIGFISATAWMGLQSRARAIGAATASVQNLALVLDKHLTRTVDAVDTLLRTALHEGEVLASSDPSHAALLTGLIRDLPYVRTVELMSDKGVLCAHCRPYRRRPYRY